MITRITFVLFLLLLVPCAYAADKTVRITGTVAIQDDVPLPGASVFILNPAGFTIANMQTVNNGGFSFQELPPGEYVVQIVAGGFVTESRKILAEPGKNLKLQITLSPFRADETLTVTASKIYELDEVPGGTAIIPETQIETSRAHNVKDVFYLTPGVLAQSRYGADESQFSIRGSGLRNNFHMRGVNILVNGIPYQDADGFSDFESIDLLATQHIEVWKGADAVRYGGNSMGGAINFVTNTGEGESLLKLNANGGSYGLFKGQISSGGVHGPFDYYVSFSDTESEGYREHSEQGRKRLFGNFGWLLNEKTRAGFDAVYADVSEKLPGSLTRDEFEQNPRQADQNNVINKWGRSYDYTRLSGRILHQLNENQDIELIVFGQYRDMVHPIFQILDQDARNFGAEIRYRINGSLLGKQNNLRIGFSPTAGSNSERRYENIEGERGNLAANFQAKAQNVGFYFENQTNLTASFILSAGGRIDFAGREFEDRFLADGDRSDEQTYSAFSPKIGILWKQNSELQFFGNVSRSYEPPLLLELTSFAAPGFLSLDAQDTWQFEIGSRGRISKRIRWDFSLYDAEINNELINLNIQPFPSAPFTIPSYRNVENTRHTGLELASEIRLNEGWLRSQSRLTFHAAYTYSRFHFVNDKDFEDNHLPGAPTHLLRAELRFEQPAGLWIAPNFDWSPSEYFLDSKNTVSNDRYFVLNLKAGFRWNDLNLFVEGSNLANEQYSGSVQVDNTAGRFFEPSNGRSVYAGLQWEL